MTRRERFLVGGCFAAGALVAGDVALLRPESPAAWAVLRGLGPAHAFVALSLGWALRARGRASGVHVIEAGPLTRVRLPRGGPGRAAAVGAVTCATLGAIAGIVTAVAGPLPPTRLAAGVGAAVAMAVTVAAVWATFALAARRAAKAGDDLVLDADAGTLRVPTHTGGEDLLVLAKQVAGAGVQTEAARDDYGHLTETFVVTLRVSRSVGKVTDVPLIRCPRDHAKALMLAEWIRERLKLDAPTREVRGPTTWRPR